MNQLIDKMFTDTIEMLETPGNSMQAEDKAVARIIFYAAIAQFYYYFVVELENSTEDEMVDAMGDIGEELQDFLKKIIKKRTK